MADIKDVIVRIKVEGSEVALARIASIERSRAKLAQATAQQTRAMNNAGSANNNYRKSVDGIVLSEKELEKQTRIRQQGVVQLGQQVQDFGVQVQGGQRPLVAFTQQMAQAGFIASQMGGTLGKVGSFIAGPWGTALVIGLAVLVPFLDAMKGVDDATNKAGKETAILTRAQEIARIKTLSLKDATKELAEITGYSALTNREQIVYTIGQAKAQEKLAIDTQKTTQAILNQQVVRLEQIKSQRENPAIYGVPESYVGASLEIAVSDRELTKTREKLAEVTNDLAVKTSVVANANKVLADLDAEAAKARAADAKKAQDEAERRTKAAQKEIDQTREFADSIREAQDPFIKFNEEVTKIREAQGKGFLTAAEAANAIFDAFETASEAAERMRYKIDNVALSLDNFSGKSFNDLKPTLDAANLALSDAIGYFGRTQIAAEEGFKKIKDGAAEAKFPIQEFADEMGRTTEAFLTGTATIKEAVGSMVAYVLKELAKVAIAKFVTSLFGAADGAAFSGGAKTPAAKGAAFDGHQYAFARGGVVNRPTNFAFSRGGVPSMGLMGEAGPEAIMPLKRDKAGKLGVSAPAVNVQIINNAGAQVSAQADDSGNLKIFVEHARRAVAADIRSGGNLVSSSVERTYGLSRGGAG
jgi:hypothetical protein